MVRVYLKRNIFWANFLRENSDFSAHFCRSSIVIQAVWFIWKIPNAVQPVTSKPVSQVWWTLLQLQKLFSRFKLTENVSNKIWYLSRQIFFHGGNAISQRKYCVIFRLCTHTIWNGFGFGRKKVAQFGPVGGGGFLDSFYKILINFELYICYYFKIKNV